MPFLQKSFAVYNRQAKLLLLTSLLDYILSRSYPHQGRARAI